LSSDFHLSFLYPGRAADDHRDNMSKEIVKQALHPKKRTVTPCSTRSNKGEKSKSATVEFV
jgi:hypothetical protein